MRMINEITIDTDWKFYPPENNLFIKIFFKILKGQASQNEVYFAKYYAKKCQSQ